MLKVSKTVITMLIFGYAFLFIPILFLIISSFSDSEIPGNWTNFSLRWFHELLEDEDLVRAMMTSFKIACISASGAVILGTLAAVATTNTGRYFGKNFLTNSIAGNNRRIFIVNVIY